jgi:hypothetical protein
MSTIGSWVCQRCGAHIWGNAVHFVLCRLALHHQSHAQRATVRYQRAYRLARGQGRPS